MSKLHTTIRVSPEFLQDMYSVYKLTENKLKRMAEKQLGKKVVLVSCDVFDTSQCEYEFHVESGIVSVKEKEHVGR